MAASSLPDTDWQPRACTASECGRLLQAQVAYCPFCGAAQADAAARPQVAEGTAATSDTNKRRATATATPPSPPPVMPQPAPVVPQPPALPPEAEPVPESPPPHPQPTARPAPAAPSRPGRVRKWPRVAATLLAVIVLALWLRPKPEPAWVARCDALSAAVNDALTSGDLTSAETSLIQAQALCQGERRDALAPLSEQVARAYALAKTCSAAIKNTESLLERNRPSQARSRLAQHKDACTGYTPYDALNERVANQLQQATHLIEAGFAKLQVGELDAAEQSLAQAVALDVQASDADRLRTALTHARRQQAADAATPINPVTLIPAPPAGASPVASSTDALVAELLRDGRDALARKTYAEAKSSARNALRLSPGSRAANDLLQKAESAERQALQDIVID